MKKQFLIVLIRSFGILLIILGIIGLLLPFLQGVLFIVIGVYVLSLVSPRITNYLDQYAQKHPWARKLIYRLEKPAMWIKRKFDL